MAAHKKSYPDQAEPQLEFEEFNVIRISDVEHSDRQLVTKSHKFIYAFTHFSLNEQRLLGAAISKINPMKELDDRTLIRVDLHASEISELTGIDRATIKRFAHKAALSYHSMPVSTPGKKPGTIDVINIAYRSRFDPETDVFSITFHPLILPEIVALKSHFASYRLVNFVSLGSKYHTRFFEFMAAAKNGRIVCKLFDPEDLSRSLYFVLGLKEFDPVRKVAVSKSSLIRHFGIFRDRILLPAIEELAAKTDLRISLVDVKKRGRSVYAVVLEKSVGGEQGLIRALSSLGLPREQSENLLRTFGFQAVSDNLALLQEKLANGQKIDSPAGYLRHLLRHQVSTIPEKANPYSKLYEGRKTEQKFLRRVVMPNWGKLPKEVQGDIEEFGMLSAHLIDDYMAFLEQHRSSEENADAFLLMLEGQFPSRF